MHGEELEERARAATAAVREAGALAAEYFRGHRQLTVERKGIQDLVSTADRACETLIVDSLTNAFPDDSFLGEEGGLRTRGDALWIIDPIDGTANFLRGISLWCVSVGLLAGGRPVLGLIYDPIADELFSATQGGGATLNGAPIRTTGETALDQARICLGFSYRRPVEPHARDVETLLNARCEYSRLGSGALALAYTAAGRFDGYWERHINAWDVAAGLVLVHEAGGRTNDFFADEGLAKGNPILAATAALYEPLSALLDRD